MSHLLEDKLYHRCAVPQSKNRNIWKQQIRSKEIRVKCSVYNLTTKYDLLKCISFQSSPVRKAFKNKLKSLE